MRGKQAGATKGDPLIPGGLERWQSLQVPGPEAMALGVNRGHGNARRMQRRGGGDDFSAEERGYAELDDAGTRASFEVDDMDRDR